MGETETKKKSKYLVEVKDLKEYFPIKTGFFKTTPLKAVDGVSFNIEAGKTLGLVGESGCGKTTVGRTLLRLYKPTGGEFYFDGELVTDKNIYPLRRQMQMVFQDPYSSLNPRMTVEDIIGEPLDIHHLYTTKQDRHDKIMHLMEMVGLNAEHATRYAHEFSGGQRQRIGIARALAVNPRFIVFPFRRRLSICLRNCRISSALHICSLRMICSLSIIFPTGLRSCIWAESLKSQTRMI